MDIASITNIIGSLGVPTVICLLLLKYLEQEQEAHKEEIASLKDVLTNLTVAITSLKERFEHDDTGRV